MRPGDRLAVFQFADSVTQLTGFSSDVNRLQSAVRHISAGDGTALYDAVYLGAEALAKGTPGRRRVLILLTDAGETTSRADFETARRSASRAEVLLYTIVMRPVKNEGGRNTAGEHALETIADTTGGAMCTIRTGRPSSKPCLAASTASCARSTGWVTIRSPARRRACTAKSKYA